MGASFTDGQVLFLILHLHWLTGPYPKEDFLQGGLATQEGRQTRFFAALPPMNTSMLTLRVAEGKSRMLPNTVISARAHNSIYLFDLKLAQAEGLVLWQTLPNVIILNGSMLADCLVKVVRRHLKDIEEGIMCQTVTPEPRKVPRVVDKLNLAVSLFNERMSGSRLREEINAGITTPLNVAESEDPETKLRITQLHLDCSESQVRSVQEIQELQQVVNMFQVAQDFQDPGSVSYTHSGHVPGEPSVFPSFFKVAPHALQPIERLPLWRGHQRSNFSHSRSTFAVADDPTSQCGQKPGARRNHNLTWHRSVPLRNRGLPGNLRQRNCCPSGWGSPSRSDGRLAQRQHWRSSVRKVSFAFFIQLWEDRFPNWSMFRFKSTHSSNAADQRNRACKINRRS